MEHWKFILFFAAAFISITPAQWNKDGSLLPQPNIANKPQPNYVNMHQPNYVNMPQPYAANMPQPYDTSYSEPLEVVSCEFYAKENAKAHHTEKYDLVQEEDPSPVLRRGQPFQMAIVFRRLFKMDSDSVTLELTLGSKEMKKRGPPVFLPVTPKKEFTHDPSNWDISLSNNSKPSRRLTVQIQIPYTAAVGLWRMNVISKVKGGNQPKKHDCNKDVYILFNPWSKEDLVYMEDDIGRQEYVLNDDGDLYNGRNRAIPWNFAQFHKTVLPATIFVLEKAQSLDEPYLDFASRSDPIKVIQTISAMVNGEDENGVLKGQWYGNYEGGTPPMEWTGSEPILKEYVLSGGETVKYGQCWVFSALSTTICRTLGLPCRSVTNFNSALDKNGDLVITSIRYPDGSKTRDSEAVWNFHVWNECWMTRPDLKPEYSGWQAFDGTPELRDKTEIFRAGPASVLAVRRGEIDIVHNSQVFFAAANCDQYFYDIDIENQNTALSGIDIRSMGLLILTKKPRSDKPDDITRTYKPREGTHEERKIYNFARAKIGRSSRFLVRPTQRKGKADVCFTLRHIPKVMIGKRFKMFVDVANNSDKKRTISFTASINSAFYNGVIAKKVKSDTGKLILRPWQRKTLVFEVGPNIYLDKLVEFCYLRAYARASVLETNQTWAREYSFQFRKPPLQIEYEDEAVRPRLFQALKISFSFTNPLKVTLNDCAIIIEGLGLVEFSKTKLGDLGPGEALTHVATITPTKVGSHRLIAVFTSQLMAAVLGSKKVEVEAV